jgi:DNA-binding response OmpR family regulator
LIEDDPRVVRFVRRGLAAEGYAVDVAENGGASLPVGRDEIKRRMEDPSRNSISR